MKCKECQKELVQTEGKRAKKFCNSTCRSNYWQKQQTKKESAPKSENKKQEPKKEVAVASNLEAEFQELLKQNKDGK